jgi:hypothetical protein
VVFSWGRVGKGEKNIQKFVTKMTVKAALLFKDSLPISEFILEDRQVDFRFFTRYLFGSKSDFSESNGPKTCDPGAISILQV